MRRVVITGLGLVTPAGGTVEAFFDALCAGRSAVSRLVVGGEGDGRDFLAARVEDLDIAALLNRREASRLDRAVLMSVLATARALTDAGLGWEGGAASDLAGIGVVVGTGVGTAHTLEKNYFSYFSRGAVSAHAIASSMPHRAGAILGIRFGLGGPSFTVSTACSSGAVAVSLAADLIRAGSVPIMLAGGCDACLTPIHLDNWSCLGVLAPVNGEPRRAVRPFSRDREGFALGEGAVMLVLEDEASARQRGAPIYAELLASGLSSDASHITAPCGEGQARAMRKALAAAEIAPAEVDYINAHGTATQLNDSTEVGAIRAVFGDAVPPISSIKAVTGHMLAASGAAELAATVLSVQRGRIPPTANFTRADEGCELDFVAEGYRDLDCRIALSNSFAFGGNNAALLVRRHETQ